jgi:hypothetical protein
MARVKTNQEPVTYQLNGNRNVHQTSGSSPTKWETGEESTSSPTKWGTGEESTCLPTWDSAWYVRISKW